MLSILYNLQFFSFEEICKRATDKTFWAKDTNSYHSIFLLKANNIKDRNNEIIDENNI